MTWSWPLLAWGVLTGLAWVAGTAAVFRLCARYLRGDAGRTARRYARRYPVWASVGIPAGLMSAGSGSRWPDLLFTAYAVLALVLPLGMLPRLRRAAADAACESGGGCVTCPIACDRRLPAG